MNVTMIHGQSHHGSSYHLAHKLVKQFPEAIIHEFFLTQALPVFCCGCYRCMDKDITSCPHESYMRPIVASMLESELLIFTTPTYCLHASGAMKSFLDHLFTWFMVHQPRTENFSKQALIITTAAGTGMKRAAKDIKDSLAFWGISDIQILAIRTMSASWEQMSIASKQKAFHKLKLSAKHIRNRLGQGHVSIKTKLIFHVMRLMQKRNKGVPEDKQYWEAMGWLAANRPWK